MNLAFLPDLSALAILIGILLLLRRSHSRERTDIWLLGLIITFVESFAHTLYPPSGPPSTLLHVIVVDGYLLAGLVFNWASGDYEISRRSRLLYLGLNGLPLLAVNTMYGLHLRVSHVYLPVIAIGLVLGVITSLFMRSNRILAAVHLFGWLGMAYIISHGDYRRAVYWSLCCVYSIAAVNFRNRLPRASTGRLAIVTGFLIWALCFFIHPWIVNYPAYTDIASHIWNMQKSLISIGMILVMLEEQVSSNQWLALHDELTGLANRRLFEDRLASALDQCRRARAPLTILLMDLNDFKHINDSYGHHAGDFVLCEVARNLCDTLHPSDTLARLGGDEFVLLTTDLVDHRAIGHRIDAMRTAIERPIMVAGRPMTISASLGTAMYPQDGSDSTTLLRLADQRMYAIKSRPVGRKDRFKDVSIAAG